MNKIDVFIERLSRIGIEVVLYCNSPWIYIDEINNKKVTEICNSNHGFTLAYLPIRVGEDIKFTDIKEIFKLIRKYK